MLSSTALIRQVVLPFGLAVAILITTAHPAAAYGGDREYDGPQGGRSRGHGAERPRWEGEDEDGPARGGGGGEPSGERSMRGWRRGESASRGSPRGRYSSEDEDPRGRGERY